MTYAEMVSLCAQAARKLDAAADDWRSLVEIEEALWPLATGLAEAMAVSSRRSSRLLPEVRQAGSDVRHLSNSLTWVRAHAHHAQETDLRNHLDTALRSAMGALDYLDQEQRARTKTSLPQARTA